MPDQLFSIVIAILAILIVIPTLYFDGQSNKRRIRDILVEKGATHVRVTWQWAWGDRAHLIYMCDYIDRAGQRCRICCKVSKWTGSIYWSEPPEV